MAERMVAINMAFVGDKADAAAIAEAERLTHDLLLDQLGTRRRGGVMWRHYGAAAGIEVCEGLDREAGRIQDPKMLQLLRATPDAVLIVATCTYESTRG